ncbi:hymenoptaecin-like [Microplitis mediator]|uniref:hymenoptaecin-like n=1 Tax=Microplitis mediator TaxID=375433 RepID=UPI0025574FC0|nr:hymenoptaecin-like [Microplitis mediator]
MKFVLIGLLVALVYVEAQSFVPRPGNGVPRPPINYPIPPFNPGPPRWPSGYRFRRSPQGEVDASVVKPGEGPAQVNLDYNQKLFTDDTSSLSAHGRVSSTDFSHFNPSAGVNYEWNPNKDTYLRAQTELQRLPTGRMEPSFGAQFGMRFRREIEE